MADTLTIVRLASAWEQPSVRAELAALPQTLAAHSDAVIYRGRNTLTRLTIGGREVVTKAFPAARTLLKRVQRIGRDSKALRAYDHAERMQHLGIGTPKPLAVVEADDGRAWYVCEWADGCTTLRSLYRETGPEIDRLCAVAGDFVGRMHQAGAYHYDSTPGNLLLQPDGRSLLVVDCNRMRFGRVGRWAGLRSLVQLDPHGRLLESYCAARHWNPAHLRWLYRVRLLTGSWILALKKSTRPWRRSLGV